MNPVTLNMQTRYAVQIGDPGSIHVALIGCGGTGSFLALHLARLAWDWRERHSQDIRLLFIDPDRVEEKNVGRQNFAPCEISQAKAVQLAHRYSLAFGLPIEALAERFTTAAINPMLSTWDALRIVVGAVDNAAARQAIHTALSNSPGKFWWIDCGNHHDAGQVLIGNRVGLQAPEINPLGFCSALPAPSTQHPELLDAEPDTPDTAVSCADLALADAQSLMVNQATASWAINFVHRLLLRRLDVYATYFDLATGSARSLAITGNGHGRDRKQARS